MLCKSAQTGTKRKVRSISDSAKECSWLVGMKMKWNHLTFTQGKSCLWRAGNPQTYFSKKSRREWPYSFLISSRLFKSAFFVSFLSLFFPLIILELISLLAVFCQSCTSFLLWKRSLCDAGSAPSVWSLTSTQRLFYVEKPCDYCHYFL